MSEQMPAGLPGLQRARKRSKMTQKELAEKVGVTPEYIGFLENGRATPSLQIVYALANATGVHVSYLLRSAPAPAPGHFNATPAEVTAAATADQPEPQAREGRVA